ncbi:MAG: sigma-70 family RNA polymerase sigma factor [Candidatus Doudnabacteria bacterium]|nr:sigma-70 family RNA polymerase sigma factor [Candidatus Doudnabacteria bacterium]
MATDSNQNLNTVYSQYFKTIYKYFYFKLLSVEAAEDLTSDTFLAFAEKSQTDEVRNVKSFLYGVAYHKLQEYLRQKYTLPQTGLEVEHMAEKEDVEDFVQQESSLTPEEKILRVLDKLPEQQKEIIRMRIIEKLTLSEICDKMGKDMSYVKTTQNRAIKKLKELLIGIPTPTNNMDIYAETLPVSQLD